MRSLLFTLLHGVALASPAIDLRRPFPPSICAAIDGVIAIAHEQTKATAFCSSYLQIATYTTTTTVTKTSSTVAATVFVTSTTTTVTAPTSTVSSTTCVPSPPQDVVRSDANNSKQSRDNPGHCPFYYRRRNIRNHRDSNHYYFSNKDNYRYFGSFSMFYCRLEG